LSASKPDLTNHLPVIPRVGGDFIFLSLQLDSLLLTRGGTRLRFDQLPTCQTWEDSVSSTEVLRTYTAYGLSINNTIRDGRVL
jgi:hypothetical protein